MEGWKVDHNGKYIQGDSRGKINTLGSDNMDHCKKKKLYEHVSNSEWLPR
jgi:hypothetical protein